MGYAFISYSSKDQEYALALRDLLHKQGIPTWMAPYDIPPGTRYAAVISQTIRECGCCVMILSNAAQESGWVASEIERVRNYRKPLIPVSIEDVKLNDEFELYLSTSQILRVRKADETSEEIQHLIHSVKTALGMYSDPERVALKGMKRVTMGEYYYGTDGSKCPLDWIVLKETEQSMLVLCEKIIDNTPYHKEGMVFKWSDCSLRKWLNEDFIEFAFTQEEKELLLESNVYFTRNIFYHKEDNTDCRDKVFLLCVEDLKEYLGTKEKILAVPTPYAEEKGIYRQEGGLYWTRTPGDTLGMQTYVNTAGGIVYEGCYQQRPAVGIRPAMWIRKK